MIRKTLATAMTVAAFCFCALPATADDDSTAGTLTPSPDRSTLVPRDIAFSHVERLRNWLYERETNDFTVDLALLASQGLSDADQAAILRGIPNRVGQADFILEPFYSQNIAPLNRALVQLSKHVAPTEVPLAALEQLDRQVQAVFDLEPQVLELANQDREIEAQIVGVEAAQRRLNDYNGIVSAFYGGRKWQYSCPLCRFDTSIATEAGRRLDELDRPVPEALSKRLSDLQRQEDALRDKFNKLTYKFVTDLGTPTPALPTAVPQPGPELPPDAIPD
jgi:hypothetical protein